MTNPAAPSAAAPFAATPSADFEWEYAREGRAVRARLLHGGEEIASCLVRRARNMFGDESEDELEIDEESMETVESLSAEDVDWPDEAVAWRKVWG